jgi:hypothetical protein
MRVLVPLLVALAAGAAGFSLVACLGGPARANDDAMIANAILTTCAATTPPDCSGPTLHYGDVVPILQKSCIPCHPGPPDAGQWPLTAYGDVGPWAGVIQDEVCANAMPPLDGGIPIAESDRLTILDWVRCGAPE